MPVAELHKNMMPLLFMLTTTAVAQLDHPFFNTIEIVKKKKKKAY